MSHRLAPKGPLGSAEEWPRLSESPPRVRGPGPPAEEVVSKTTVLVQDPAQPGRGWTWQVVSGSMVSQLILTVTGLAHHQQMRSVPRVTPHGSRVIG